MSKSVILCRDSLSYSKQLTYRWALKHFATENGRLVIPGQAFWDVVDLTMLRKPAWVSGFRNRVARTRWRKESKSPPLFLRTKIFIQFLQRFPSPNALGVQVYSWVFLVSSPDVGPSSQPASLPEFLLCPDYPPPSSYPVSFLSVADTVQCWSDSSPERKADLWSSPHSPGTLFFYFILFIY